MLHFSDNFSKGQFFAEDCKVRTLKVLRRKKKTKKVQCKEETQA